MSIKSATSLLVTHNIKPVNGGKTVAVLLRADALAEVSEKVIVFTFGFDSDWFGSLNFWKGKLKNFSKIAFINIFEDVENPVLVSEYVKWNLNDNSQVRIPDEKNPKAFRVFVEGLYKRYEAFSSDGRLKSIDHFEAPWVRTSKSVFNKNGARIVEHYFDKSSNKLAFSVYFNSSGKAVYSCRYDMQSGSVGSFFDLEHAVEFKNIWQLVACRCEKIIKQNDNIVLFVDDREFMKFCPIGADKTIFVLHSTHLSSPGDDVNKIEPTMEPVLSNLNKLSDFVVFTQEQFACLVPILRENGHKLRCIPHAIGTISDKEQQPIGFHNVVVSSFGCYYHAKNLVDAIRAFKIVSVACPDAIFNLYGYGPEEDKLKRTIQELNLEDKCFIKGFCRDVPAVLKQSCVTVSTSRYEGFGLSILESMAYGIPHVAYDCKFGPAEIITNGIDGFVVKKYDIQELADKIVFLLLNKVERMRMSQEARKIVNKFSIDRFKREWISLLQK